MPNPPLSLQTAEHAEAAVRKFAKLGPHIVLRTSTDPEVSQAFVVSTDSEKATGKWWYGPGAEVHEIVDEISEIKPRRQLLAAIDRIDRAFGTSKLELVITRDPACEGAYFLTYEDEESIDSWSGPRGEIVIAARTNGVASEEFARVRREAMLVVHRMPSDTANLPGIFLP